jgi:Tfp pilus assembly protein PilN
MNRRKRLLLAMGGVLVLLAVSVVSGFLMASHSPTGESRALSDAFLASQRASAGARLVGAAKSGDRVGSPTAR